jgi:hypothetical protein
LSRDTIIRDKSTGQSIIAKIHTFSVWRDINQDIVLSDVVINCSNLIENFANQSSPRLKIDVYEKRHDDDWSILFVLDCSTCERTETLDIWKSIAHSVQTKIKEMGLTSSKHTHRIRIEVRGRYELERRGIHE